MDSNWNIEYFERTLEEMLNRMSKIGNDPAGGFTRFIYTDDWFKGLNEVKAMMNEAGLEVYCDSVGNLFGKLESDNSDKTIMSGSHIDTVRNGGLYDGLYGILAALAAAKFLKESFGAPKKNIEVLAVAEEEGSRFPYSYWGAHNIIESISESDMEGVVDSEGLHITNEMRKYGFNYKDAGAKIRDDIEKFIEIHIEQGGVLEHEKKSIGIVDAIVGLRRFSVEIEGEANHAGTTPMAMRKDAMNTASHIISRLLDAADSYGAPLVLTVGSISVHPNVMNVVPEKVTFSIDTRHTDNDFLNKISNEIEQVVNEETKKRGTKAKITLWTEEAPTPLDKDARQVFEDICITDNIPFMHINSGAGHDSQIMAKKYDAAMLFVPSVNGISHSPKEHTELSDLARGAYVLAKTLYKLAYA